MPTFDWHTETGEPRQDAPFVVYSEEKRPSRWRIWLEVTFIVSLISFFTYQQVSRWVDTVSANVRESPRAAFGVWQTAIAANDPELFDSIILKNNLDWFINQQKLFSQNLIFDRQVFGLSAVGEPAITAVDLAPNLTSATVTFAQNYQHSPNQPITQLHHTADFQLHDDRWLLSPPDGRYWGSWHVDERDYLTLVYTDRDAVIGRRLAADLDKLVAESCAQLNCAPDFRLWVPLRANPSSLVQLTDWQTMMKSGRNIPLPSPSLVGVPQDEAGYQALLHGYGRWLVSAVFTGQVGWRCCDRLLFYQALLDKQLQRMGLNEWPLTTADYDTMLAYHFDIAQLNGWWRDNPAAETGQWQVLAFIDFLAAESNIPVPELLASLVTAPTFRQWVELAFASPGLTEIELRHNWLQFVYAHTSSAQRERPYPLPAAAQLLCASRQGLVRYGVAGDSWTHEMSLDESAIMLLSPFAGGAILYEQVRDTSAGQSWTILPQSGEPDVLLFDSPLSPVYLNDNAPGQPNLVAANLAQSGPPYLLLDLEGCLTTGCVSTRLPRLPLWSPNGRHTLMTLAAAPPPFYILLGDSRGRVARDVGTGILPFWLDDQTFGYLRQGSQSEIVTASIQSPTAVQPLLSAADLLAILPITGTLAIRQIWAHPPAPRWLFIEAVTPDLSSQYIFAYDQESGEVSLRLHLDARERFIAFRFSPDGRYWTLITHATHDPIGANWKIYLHNISANETEEIAYRPLPYAADYSYDWYADGRWLLKADSGVLQLMVPDEDYFELVYYDGGRCTSAVWLQSSSN